MLRPPSLVILLALSACGQAEDNPCPLGQEWSQARERCVAEESASSGVGGSGATPAEAGQGGDAQSSAGQGGQAPGTGGQSTGSPGTGGQSTGSPATGGQTGVPQGGGAGLEDNLGVDCDTDADCVGGVAIFCLKNPNTPDVPGDCSILNCTSAACGDVFDCCDCSTSETMRDIMVEPRCYPPGGVEVMTSYGCVCT